jgi:hypothetical protein
MPIGPGKRRVQAIIDDELAGKIQDLARRLQVSESTCIYMLLDSVIANESWMVKLVTSRFGSRFAKLFGIAGTNREKYVDANRDLDGESSKG